MAYGTGYVSSSYNGAMLARPQRAKVIKLVSLARKMARAGHTSVAAYLRNLAEDRER